VPKDEIVDDIDLIPLKNLPHSELTVFKYEDSSAHEEFAHPNNVLISCLDSLQSVCIVGKDLNGEMYFSSSTDDIDIVLLYLERFTALMHQYKLMEQMNGSDD
jgi:hypothetical protein